MSVTCPADARSLSCVNGLECKEFAPDARLWNLNYVQTAYTWRTPQWTPFETPIDAVWSSMRTDAEVARIVRRVATHIKAFVWGIKTSSLTGVPGADLEFYFYGYHWDVVRDAIDDVIGCSVRNLSVPFVPMMISVNVPLADQSVHEVDVYEGRTSSAYVQYNDSTHEYKNHYWLDFVKTRDASTSETVGAQLDWVGLQRRHLIFDEWEFGLAVARKTRERKGIYFSGVSVDRARPLVPEVIRKTLSMAPGSALIDVAFDVVDDEIVNTCVYNGYIAEKPRTPKRVVSNGVNVHLLPALVHSKEVAQLRSLYSPDRQHPLDYPLSFGEVGEYRARIWNSIPADECYHHHGVLVRDHTGVEGPPRLREFDWITQRIRQVTGPVRLLEVRSKSHIKRSNGVWLHTDSQREHLDWLRVDTEPGLTRDFLLLIYLSTLRDADGGKLHVFANTSEHPNTERVGEYQSNVPISFHGPVTTDKVGGEWKHGVNTFHTILELSPVAGTGVLLDHRHVDNVHAVTRMHTAVHRELLEVWFSTAI